jgi:ribosome biogenesis GTPase A
MARYFNIDGKVVRAAILEGRYKNYTLVMKGVSNRQEILVLEYNTSKVITKLRSITAAMKYAKVNFYTMKRLIETNEPHNGKIFKYNKTMEATFFRSTGLPT